MISKGTLLISIFFLIIPIVSAEYCQQKKIGTFNETVQVYYDNGVYINDAIVNVTTYFPNGTIYEEDISCFKRINDTKGWYDCNLTVSKPYGIYIENIEVYDNSGSIMSVSGGCYESVGQLDREYYSDFLNPLGLIMIAGVLFFLGMNFKGKYGVIMSLIFVMFGLLWIIIGANAIASTWGEVNMDVSKFGEVSAAMAVYTMWIPTVLIVILFIYFLLKDFVKVVK